ncbi:MAG: DNA polymerase-3 subunit gamma/tau [Gammaproteobacteria bacterium]|jgi:DNA polymerase-3 subunit gamma/tau
MTYQALARKWRPRDFSELVGQAHVVKALSNALDQGRVHHAFLFTGTRGVGKTTVARILAKCLNCDRGVSSTPCGECSSCLEIDGGRHIDLLEVDAASRAKVDETRELMNNVQFAPTRATHKIYLIDEVHMFSDASFNALLKTLEEPPPHVKFLLATTDPQRMPITVLSRCLQFSLKRLPADQTSARLEHILNAEGVAYELPALRMLARSADGSLRDALSLLDQAIAHGAGVVEVESVRAMLGLLDRAHVRGLIEHLIAGDGVRLLAQVDAMASEVADFGEGLAELLGVLKQIAVAQMVPEAPLDEELADWVRSIASSVAAEDIQLFYQIGLIGRRDLPLAPDPRTGFEMVLLRMLAFQPAVNGDGGAASPGSSSAAGRVVGAAPLRRAGAESDSVESSPVADYESGYDGAHVLPVEVARPPMQEGLGDSHNALAAAESMALPSENASVTPCEPQALSVQPSPDDWTSIVRSLDLQGLTRELAANCELLSIGSSEIRLRLAPEHRQLTAGSGTRRFEEALSAHFGRAVHARIDVGARQVETPALITDRESVARREEAIQRLQVDPGVIALVDAFSGHLEVDSIKSTD